MEREHAEQPVAPNSPSHKRLARYLITFCAAGAILLAISLFAKIFGDFIRADSIPVEFSGYHFSQDEQSKLGDILAYRQLRQGTGTFSGPFENQNYGTHWLWVDADRIDPSKQIILIELAWLDHINFYAVAESGASIKYEAGDDKAFSQRVIPFRKPAFPILRSIEDEPVEVFVFEIEAQGRISFPAIATDQAAFDTQRDLDHFFYGGIVSILLALGLYNATIFFSLRENVHFYYMSYIFAFGFLQIIASGIGQQYLWPDVAERSSLLAHIFLALTNFSVTYFVIHFISLETYSKTLFHLLRLLAWASLACIPFLFFFDYYPFKTILHACSFMIMALIFPAALYTSLRNNDVALYLLASNIVLFPSVAIGLLRFLGVFEDAYWAEHLAELGIAAEALILSVGLAYRVNLLREEKDHIALARETEKTLFAHQVIQSKEEERKVIGKALHDSLGHKIVSLKTSIQSESRDETRTGHLIEIVDQALDEVRDLSHLLYPAILDHLGLEKSIANILRKSLGPLDIDHTFEFKVKTLKLSYESELILYRAAQECINNLIKHSDASTFRLFISEGGSRSIVFTAQDNGSKAIEASDYGYGLTMLKQQANMLGGDLETYYLEGLNHITFHFIDQSEQAQEAP